ncbi:hypothetical protein D3C78_1209600 [compost metagenome]
MILLLQQHVSLDPVYLRPQPLVPRVLIEQILASGTGVAPLPEGHGRGQRPRQLDQHQQFTQAVGQLLRGEGDGQAQREIEVGRGELTGVILLAQQPQHATRREQAQIVRLMEQTDPVMGLMLILAADDGIKGVLAEEGGQGRELLAMAQLGCVHPQLAEPLGEGRADHGIVFDQEDLHS